MENVLRAEPEPILNTPGECIAWDCYFAAIASINRHPGAGTKGHTAMTLEECATEADRMLAIRRRRTG